MIWWVGGATNSVCPLPPCGGGSGWGVNIDSGFVFTPLPVLPHKEGGGRCAAGRYNISTLFADQL